MTNIEQLKEKARDKFDTYLANNAKVVAWTATINIKQCKEFIDSLLDKAVQARNEELVEFGRKLDDSIDYGTSTDPIEYSNGYHRAIKDITKLISPGRK